MGTPDFALPALKALAAAGHSIQAVYSQPPRPAGRGQRAQPSPVQAWAEAEGLAVRTPESLRDAAAQAAFAALGVDAAVVVAYGLILPRPILTAPRLGCFNLHASLLPRWRGAAPIQRAIMAGDAETGVAVMRMEAGLDTGPVLLEARQPIGPRMNAGELHDQLAQTGAGLMVEALAGVASGRLEARPQADQGVSYAAKIAKEEGHIDWQRPAAELDRLIRALSPLPGAWFNLRGERLKVLAAAPLTLPEPGQAGRVLDDSLTIACGEGALRLQIVQRAGRAPLAADAFLRGFPLPAGTKLLSSLS